MTATTPVGTALYAALSEQVHNRGKTDQSFTDRNIHPIRVFGPPVHLIAR